MRAWTRASLGIVAVALSLTPAVSAPATPPPDLTGFHAYTGSYFRDGSDQPFGLEVAEQQGRRLARVTIDAENEAQFQGRGRISKDLLTFAVNVHTPGSRRSRHRMRLHGNVIDGGAALQGDYELRRPTLAPATGTFVVSR
jgi:hypothetical protein